MSEMKPRTRKGFKLPKIAYWPLVVVLVAIGLLGLLIPVIPGILFLGLGIVVLVKVFPAVRMSWVTRQFCAEQNVGLMRWKT